MNKLSRDEQQATAYHEAGHAVMGCILSRPPQSVSIVPDDSGVRGRTIFDDDCPPSAKNYFDPSEEKKNISRFEF
jgi:ATP-dependent Zn protease